MADTNPITVPRNVRDLRGLKFGRLSPVEFAGKRGSRTAWLCRCDCGKTHVASGINLVKGGIKSCGCWQAETRGRHRITHGGTGSVLHSIWTGIKTRTTNPNRHNSEAYVGRAITLDERWLDFARFKEDMGERPSPRHTVERIDNSKGYGRDNCRWALPEEQSRNKRANVWVEMDGERMIISDWCIRYGMKIPTVYSRMERGATLKEALTIPVGSFRRPIR